MAERDVLRAAQLLAVGVTRMQQREQQLWTKVMQQKTLHAQKLRKYWRTNISVNHTNENVISILRAINCMQQTMHIKIDRKGHNFL